MINSLYARLGKTALEEFPDIVVLAEQRDEKLRLHLVDGSFVDVWFSKSIPGRWAYHWEQRHIDGTLYRHDNRPHERYRHFEDVSEALPHGER